MSLAFTLIANILPLYVLIALGYLAGKKLDVHIHSVARIVIYILSPIVTFGAMTRLKLKIDYALLPVMVLAFSCLIAGVLYTLARRRWRSNVANLIGLAAVSGNTGYFGLPLVIALYGQDAAGIYLLAVTGMTISEVTLGYYLAVRSHHGVKDSIRHALRLPSLHALWAGLLVNALHVPIPDAAYTYWTYAIGSTVFLGMMMIGIALSRLPRLEFDWRLAAWMFSAKWLCWPALAALFIEADNTYFHLFQARTHGLLLIACAVPLAANTIAYAAQLELHAEKAAAIVLASTLGAILYLPALILLAQHVGLMP